MINFSGGRPARNRLRPGQRLIRAGRVCGAALLLSGASAVAASAASKVGWVWADQQDAVSAYTADPSYSYNSAAGAVSVTPQGLGSYQVTFTGLGSTLSDGVLVTAYDTNGYCTVAGWSSPAGGDVKANVTCFDAAGAAANSKFSLVYQAHSGAIGDASRGTAFLWAEQPTSPSYEPASGYQYNSTGGSNTIVRNGVGSYTASLPGLTKTGGHVQVTAFGDIAGRCKVESWGQDEDGTRVDVRCFSDEGHPADRMFTLAYARNLPLAFVTTGTTSGLYGWASQPANDSYRLSGPYSFNSWGAGKLTATQDGLGSYEVQADGVGSYSTSNVLVTAYGDKNTYCNVQSWLPATVKCFRQGGTPINSRFDLSFQAH